uniref:Uncharacterized protein n=1 Tax=Anopheles atroparvus TaxID=41427 RepID=A0AAG5DW52_ANOAO
MSSPRGSVNLSELRIKLFGPTLDDSVLYGMDRLMDYFTVAPGKEIASRQDSANEETFYESCESFPLEAAAIQPPHNMSKFTVAKLSSKEMEYIRRAIAQPHRKSQRRLARAEPDDRNAQPEVLRSRWALAHVNEFDDGSQTYEIMKSTDEKLLSKSVARASTEIVFARFKNGRTGSYRVSQLTP